jgi:hypothetical protein
VLLSTWKHRDTPQRIADARAVVARLPADDSVAASSFLAPFVARRDGLYFFPGNRSYPEAYIARADYILTDTSDSLPPRGQELLRQYLAGGTWETVAEQGDFLLLRRVR